MNQELFIFNISLFFFGIVELIISIILLIQILKSDKIARPFLNSVFIYFFLLTIANFQQVYYNIINFSDIVKTGELRIYTTFWVFLLTLSAPIYLTYEIEKLFFQGKSIISKKHIFTIISLLLFGYYLYIMFLEVIKDINFVNTFVLANYMFAIIPLLAFQVLLFIFAFLYLAIKTTEKYRTYSLFVSLGWLLNYAINTIVTLVETIAPILVIILLIPKLLGVIITAIGFYKLYMLKRI